MRELVDDVEGVETSRGMREGVEIPPGEVEEEEGGGGGGDGSAPPAAAGGGHRRGGVFGGRPSQFLLLLGCKRHERNQLKICLP